MASEILVITDAPANNVFFVIRNAAGQVLDHADQTFKALGSATTPGLAATENTAFGGVNESSYAASLNLAYLNTTLDIVAFWIEAYRRAGGSVNLANDLLLDTQQIKVANSSLAVDGTVGTVPSGYVVHVGMNVTATIGNYVQLYAWIEFNGQPVVIAGTCVFACYEYGTTVAQWTETAVANNSLGQFELLKNLPNFTDDKKYLLKATITSGGTTLVGQDAFPVIGAA